MRTKTECPSGSCGRRTPRPADGDRQNFFVPTMPGHMSSPMPGVIPYPWMQRPMPGQPMPPMSGNSMQPMPGNMMQPMPGTWTPDMGPMDMWTMPQWNPQMWEPNQEDDLDETRDMEYWQQLYPEQTRRIQREVSHQCDLLDYEGSVMYDEYPDRIALARICESVYHTLMQNGVIGNRPNSNQEFVNEAMGSMDETDDTTDAEEQANDLAGAQNYQPIKSVDMMQQNYGGRPSRSLQDLIEVLLYQEMHRRRRHRRRNRGWGRRW